MKRTIRTVLLWAAGIAALGSFGFEKVSDEIAKAVKGPKRIRVETGLVFIDGKYIRPPYRIECRGTQILVNDRPVTGPLVPWEDLLKTQPPSHLSVEEVEVPDETESGKNSPAAGKDAAPEKDGIDPAAPKDGGNTPPPAEETAAVRVVLVESRLAADADDLDDIKTGDEPEKMKLSDIPADSEEDKARQKRAEEEKAEDAEEDESQKADEAQAKAVPTTDQNGDELDPASPEGEAAAKATAAKAPPKPAVKTRKVYSLKGPFEENARSRKLMKRVAAAQAMIASTLRRGGYVFFGAKYRVGLRTTDAASTAALLKKLPELMREAKDSESFCDACRTAGLMTYITYAVAQDLYRNRTDFAALQQRRRDLDEEEKIKGMLNGHGR